ncbi:MAG TPA: hypothetical protein VKU60_12785 [Chloroflexota bacterium]|nr:hypothetical protein [Chloroflexota bacterium]
MTAARFAAQLLILLLAACWAAASQPSAAPSSSSPTVAAAASPKPSGGASALGAERPAASAKPAASIAPAQPGQLLVACSEVVASHAPLWAAKDSGLFQQNGLNVDFRLIESSLSIGALLSAQVQVAEVGGSEALAAAVEGGDLRVLGIEAPRYAFKLEVASKKDKPFAIEIMKKYLKMEDARLLDDAYNTYMLRVTPALPYPKPEQFTDSIAQLAQKNPKAKSFDLSKLIDPSFVQSAADRGLAVTSP